MIPKTRLAPRALDPQTAVEVITRRRSAEASTLEGGLAALCRFVDDHWPAMSSAVLVLDATGQRWRTVVAPRVPERWLRHVHSAPVGVAAGACGAALARRRRVIAADIATNGLYAELRAAGAVAGLGACWAVPLLAGGGRALGVLAVHASAAAQPGPQDLRTLEGAAELARVVVERYLTDEPSGATERSWRSIFDNSVIGIAITELDGRFLATNHAFQEMLGYSDDELACISSVELTCGADQARSAVADALLLTGDMRETQIEKRYRRRDGRYIWVRVTSSLIAGTREAPALRIRLIEDITDRKRAEDDLWQSEAHLAEAQRIGRTGSWVMNLASGDLLWSQEMFHICGLDPAAGQPTFEKVLARIHPDDVEQVRATVDRARREATDFEGEYRLIVPDRPLVHIHYIGHPVFDTSGSLAEFAGIIRDITAEKQAEEQIQASLTEVRSLAARQLQAQDEERRRIARELHETTAQDLAALQLNLSALDRGGALCGVRERTLLDECAALAERSMNDIRTLSYLLHPPLLDEVGLTPALRWYATGFAKRSGIEVDLVLLEDVGRLPREIETTLFRVVQECLSNIHRHSRSRAAAIRLRADRGRLIVEVQDWGRGMPAGAHLARSANRGALGVGIAGMRERIKQLGGRLEIDSGGLGTTVRAVLPASPAA